MARAPVDVHGAAGPARPELPRAHVDTTYAPPSGRTIAVPAAGDVQAALDSARPGDVITLAAGAKFTGPFVLPNKSGAGWITVRTAAPDSALPPPGTRIDPSYAPVMPKIVAPAGPGGRAIQTESGAHHFRFVGIEFRPSPGAFVVTLIRLGADETAVTALPHDIIFDRCYIHGDPAAGGRFGIAMNAASSAVIDSHVSGFADAKTDATGIWVTNGAGPFKIANNYLEATGEGLMFGGQDPEIRNLVPADIEIRGNHFAKPLSWRVGDPVYAGLHWLIKNLFELKNARRVLIDGNIFEDNWKQGDQDGFAIVFTPRNQSGGSSWSTVEDVTFTHNIVRHSTAGVYILGWDYTYPSRQTQRVLIQNNLFTDIGAFANNGGSVGRLFMLADGPANVVIDHNTAFQDECPVYVQVHNPRLTVSTGFVYTNNLAFNNQGVRGDKTEGVMDALSTYFPGAVFAGNVLVGGGPSSYPPNNFFPSALAGVAFTNYAGGDYRLAPSSAYRNGGMDGRDIGADLGAISAAISSWSRTVSRP
ncbi:MAG TPA: right-handed parallel beta-helix repeat-containing protein [bacterium]